MKIFLLWLYSKETDPISCISVQWFWRVITLIRSEIGLPTVTTNGTRFGDNCFFYVYSLQSISIISDYDWSFDAPSLSITIRELSWFLLDGSSDYVSSTTEEWIVGNGQHNEESKERAIILNMNRLKRVVIGDGSLGRVRRFGLIDLGELESVVIGQRSIRISNTERNDGTCRIVNCPKLKSIQIGYRSFFDYHSFELNNLPSLQSIDIGERCFYYAPSFSLTGLIDW